MRKRFRVILEPADEGGLCVYVPELPGCLSQGETEEDALENINDAISMWLDDQEAEVRDEVKTHEDWVRVVELTR